MKFPFKTLLGETLIPFLVISISTIFLSIEVPLILTTSIAPIIGKGVGTTKATKAISSEVDVSKEGTIDEEGVPFVDGGDVSENVCGDWECGNVIVAGEFVSCGTCEGQVCNNGACVDQEDPIIIDSCAALQEINDMDANYVLGTNIDCSGYKQTGEGFSPISTFTGSFDGNNNTINSLYINRTTNNVGLFGISSGILENIYLTNINVMGGGSTGGLAGKNEGIINMSYATGSVTGTSKVGGLVGSNVYADIDNSYATGSVTGTSKVGGLVGYGEGGVIDNSYATGNVTGTSYVGGLVGRSDYHQIIDNSYATGNVNGTSSGVGGLIGSFRSDSSTEGDINNSYATGNVNGTSFVGGLVGYADYYSTIDNSYATGNVTGISQVGGLIGKGDTYGGTLDNSYATGNVNGTSYVGGLIGRFSDGNVNIDNSYWLNNSDDAQNCYYDNDARGDTGCTAKDDVSYFYSEIPFTNCSWSTSIWEDNTHTYPTLIWQ